jgi:hypothetical protein
MSARDIQDQKAIAREIFVQKLLTIMRAFRLAHCGELRVAPPRVDGITLSNRQRTSSAKLQIPHLFRWSELIRQT